MTGHDMPHLSADDSSEYSLDRRSMLRKSLVGGVAATTIAGGITTGLAQPASAQSIVLDCEGDEFYNFGSVGNTGRSTRIRVPADCPVSYVIFGSGGIAGSRVQLNSGSLVGRGNGGAGGFGARWAGWIPAVPVARTLELRNSSGQPAAIAEEPQPGPDSPAGNGGTSGGGSVLRANSSSLFVYACRGGGGGAGGASTAILSADEVPGAETILIVAGAGGGGGGGFSYLRRYDALLISDAGGGNGGAGGSGRQVDGPPPPGGFINGTNGVNPGASAQGLGGTGVAGGLGGTAGGGGNATNGGFWIPGGMGPGGFGGHATYGNLVYEGGGGGGGGAGGYGGGGGGEGGNGDAAASLSGGGGAGGASSIERGSAMTAAVPASLLAQQPPFYTVPFSELGRGGINTFAQQRPAFAGAILIKIGTAEIITDSTGAVMI